ncbi:hypothetical protein EEB14_51270 [Rhodococcus sp. WS4]|nr:hypothetical protein EEB14_51270 [Rhodococcus sp. WS4]
MLVEGVDVVHDQIRDDLDAQGLRGDRGAEPVEALGPSIVMSGELAAVLVLGGVCGRVSGRARLMGGHHRAPRRRRRPTAG